jgi:hypothetical protein
MIETLLRLFAERKITKENAWDLNFVALTEYAKVQAKGKNGMAGVIQPLLVCSYCIDLSQNQKRSLHLFARVDLDNTCHRE